MYVTHLQYPYLLRYQSSKCIHAYGGLMSQILRISPI